MAKAYVFYNPIAGNGKNNNYIERLKEYVKDELVPSDMTKSVTYETTLFQLEKDDYIILCGGDGTLNHFINITDGMEINNEILYFPTGNGNDFAHDLGKGYCDEPFPITNYLQDLPLVEVNGRKHRFLNGIGYGIDGYCCEVGDEIKRTSDKPVNYTSIAIKGLLFHYKPTDAKITVDGVTHTYKKVWLAPTMNGKYYGGGMIPTPGQDRLNPDKTLSLMVFHGTGKLKTLMIFPSIFKGTHIEHREAVDILTGRDILVEFSRPASLQIDGETILGVTSYKAVSSLSEYGKNEVSLTLKTEVKL